MASSSRGRVDSGFVAAGTGVSSELEDDEEEDDDGSMVLMTTAATAEETEEIADGIEVAASAIIVVASSTSPFASLTTSSILLGAEEVSTAVGDIGVAEDDAAVDAGRDDAAFAAFALVDPASNSVFACAADLAASPLLFLAADSARCFATSLTDLSPDAPLVAVALDPAAALPVMLAGFNSHPDAFAFDSAYSVNSVVDDAWPAFFPANPAAADVL